MNAGAMKYALDICAQSLQCCIIKETPKEKLMYVMVDIFLVVHMNGCCGRYYLMREKKTAHRSQGKKIEVDIFNTFDIY